MFSFVKCRAWVPGGFKVGDAVYFCGACESLPSGNHLEYAKVGKISGVAAETRGLGGRVDRARGQGRREGRVALLSRAGEKSWCAREG